jgi:hypothetical protein
MRNLSGLRRFQLSHPEGLGGPAPYLVAETWFADAEAMKTAMKSPELGETAAHAEGFEVESMPMFTGPVVEFTA